MATARFDVLTASTVNREESWRTHSWWKRQRTFSLPLSALRQARRGSGVSARLTLSCPQSPRNSFGQRCDRACPHRSSFRQSDCKRGHESAVPVPLLEEPFPLERFACDPIEHPGVNLRAYRLHQVTCQTVAGRSVHMNEPETGIKPKRSRCDPQRSPACS